ncbi:MAG: lysophospholipid acyltransferase family protein [Gemmatimonadota bacterium]|nr:MAG: lysophospholipid acyltransferase family protein [Gemmatimonadota bacterium]
MKMRFLDRLSLSIIPFLGYYLILLLGRTWRVTTLGRKEAESAAEEKTSFIYALWHGRMLPLALLSRNRPTYVLVSQHRDGELASRLAHRLGFKTVRGSSTRGGVKGSQDLLRKVSSGFDAVIMPDGPRGPARKVQLGILRLAQLSGRPIIPVTVGASRHVTLKSWDSFIIPKPFSRCIVKFGQPLRVHPKASPQHLEEKRIELEHCLNTMTQDADAYFN